MLSAAGRALLGRGQGARIAAVAAQGGARQQAWQAQAADGRYAAERWAPAGARTYCSADGEEAVEVTKEQPPKPSMFAVVQVGGKQYKVCEGDVILADKINGVDIGENIELKKVLLVGKADRTIIGTPQVENASVLAEVQEQTKAEKLTIFKKKRRKGYRRRTGFRPHITTLRVSGLNYDWAAADAAEPAARIA